MKQMPVIIPEPIKKLTEEQLKMIENFKDDPVFDLISSLIENEIKDIKEIDFNQEPVTETPVHVDYFNKGMRKGRVKGSLLVPGIVKYAMLELKQRREQIAKSK